MQRRAFIAAGLMAAIGGASAAENDWVFLGERTVSWVVDTDNIVVTASEGMFDHLLFKVKGNDIEMLDMRVVYGNGGHDDIPLRFHIRRGGESRVIDLRGRNRVIRRVEFTYRRHLDGDGPAIVQLWGQR